MFWFIFSIVVLYSLWKCNELLFNAFNDNLVYFRNCIFRSLVHEAAGYAHERHAECSESFHVVQRKRKSPPSCEEVDRLFSNRYYEAPGSQGFTIANSDWQKCFKLFLKRISWNFSLFLATSPGNSKNAAVISTGWGPSADTSIRCRARTCNESNWKQKFTEQLDHRKIN